jgi:hypothetical protein
MLKDGGGGGLRPKRCTNSFPPAVRPDHFHRHERRAFAVWP